MIFSKGQINAAAAAAAFTLTLFAQAAAAENGWKVVKADHFIVYHQGDESFAREVARESDLSYTRIADDLGYRRHGNFWMWDNRVRIYIYPTEEEFQKLPGTREWALAMTDYAKKEIYAYRDQPDFIVGVLPHEITHLIFRDFVGTSDQIPTWMDEGVAQWEEPRRREFAKKYVRNLLKNEKAYTVDELFTVDVRRLVDKKKVEAFYMQSVSVVDFLITAYGGGAFTEFCRQLRDGRDVPEALRKAYPGLRTMEELDARWRLLYGGPAS
jgi:hypothetical protein